MSSVGCIGDIVIYDMMIYDITIVYCSYVVGFMNQQTLLGPPWWVATPPTTVRCPHLQPLWQHVIYIYIYMQNRGLLWPPAEDLRSLCMITLHWSMNESLLGQGQAVAEWFFIEIPSYHGIKAWLVGDVRLLMVKVVLFLSIANSSYSTYLSIHDLWLIFQREEMF